VSTHLHKHSFIKQQHTGNPFILLLSADNLVNY